ncbi:MAG: lipase family protein [Rhodothermales bacterium]|nr:lipase family protein [Rhodothermales bacterium]
MRSEPTRRSLARGLIAAVMVVAVAGCSDDPVAPPVDENERGALLGVQRVEIVSEARIESFDLPIPIRSAVELSRIVYRTVTPSGELTEASALIAVPTDLVDPLELASYQHGTLVRKDVVASIQGTDDPEALVAVALATDGYFAVMPDYLGLGLSPGLHPFVHASSLATAVVDALRAARHYADREGIELDERVFLMGYSEGGYATAAAQRLIESEHTDEFLLAASAPMAAPWNLSGSMVELFRSEETYPAPHFLPYTIVAYNDVYDIDDNWSNIFAEPYAGSIPPLFDGSRSGGEIDRELPDIPRRMLTAEFIEGFDPGGSSAWRDRLEENDLLAWTPTTRTRIYHCTEDDLVPYDNAEAAVASFRSLGVAETLVDVSSGDFGTHGECAPVFLLLAKFWIDDIRSGSPAKTAPAVDELRALKWRPIR